MSSARKKAADAATLAERARTLLYCPGETVLRAGAEGGSMFVVLRRRVEIRVPQPDGRRVRVAVPIAS